MPLFIGSIHIYVSPYKGTLASCISTSPSCYHVRRSMSVTYIQIPEPIIIPSPALIVACLIGAQISCLSRSSTSWSPSTVCRPCWLHVALMWSRLLRLSVWSKLAPEHSLCLLSYYTCVSIHRGASGHLQKCIVGTFMHSTYMRHPCIKNILGWPFPTEGAISKQDPKN